MLYILQTVKTLTERGVTLASVTNGIDAEPSVGGAFRSRTCHTVALWCGWKGRKGP